MATQKAVTLTINSVTQTVTRTGDEVSSRDDVIFTIAGIGSASVGDLVFNFSGNRKLLATLNTFSDSGGNAEGTVKFAQTNMAAFFNGISSPRPKKVKIALYDTANDDTLINDEFEIKKDPWQDEFSEGTTSDTGIGNIKTTGATTENNIPFWASTDRELDPEGYETETTLSGDSDKIPFSVAVKNYADSLLTGFTATLAQTLKRTANDFSAGINQKSTTSLTDKLLIEDSADSNKKKWIFLSDLPGVSAASAAWGNISGTLANQTDLQNALDAKTANDDTDVSGNDWVVDEDDMASDLDTKVPTQQSVKAYVDNNRGGGLAWEKITASDTAANGEGFLIDPASNTTLTLPTSPSEGDSVGVCAIDLDYTITVGRNGENIEGDGSDLVVDIAGAGFTLVYTDATTGWKIVSEISGGGVDIAEVMSLYA